MKTMNRFDPTTHTHYMTCDGMDSRPVPSVTQIVNGVLGQGRYKPEDLAWYLQRGSMIHKAAALLLAGRLDWTKLDARIEPYVRAIDSAIRQNNIVPNMVETTLYHQTMRFAGTFDLLDNKAVLYDWKKGQDELVQIQTGGYAELCAANRIPVKGLVSIGQLSDTGTYRSDHFKVEESRRLFRACYSLYGFCQRNNK